MLKIKEIRLRKNISAKEIAENCSISERMLYDYETGKRDIMLSKLQSIAEFLNVSLNELIDISEQNNVVQEPSSTYTLNQRDVLTAKEEVIKSLKRENELLREMLEDRKSKQG